MSPTPGPGRATLVLVATAVEARLLDGLGGLGAARPLEALCGFGPVAAAANAARLFERLGPRRALLIGVAGSYDLDRLPLGSARAFARVALDGVGAGEGRDLRGAQALGFSQRLPGRAPLGDEPELLALARPPLSKDRQADLLLTVCAAAAGDAMTRERRVRFPAALAEDMEGFGVALAAEQAGVPLAVVRGISNAVGDRDVARWDLRGALGAARRLALELLDGSQDWELGP
jgi:futalosine hydrolase